ncbi:unnamed protein product [Rotaria sp. Silwood2]|nr:unnamed protein product [Rotaria sp. Silwood2]
MVETEHNKKEFFELCKKKFQHIKDDLILDNYNNYLNRCGLKDIIDLFHQCKLKSFIKKFIFNINNVKNDIDRLILNYLLGIALERFIYDENTQLSTVETNQIILTLLDNEKNHAEQTLTKNYIKHTICTYLALLLDTRNEHALIHCLATPARAGIERRTIVELRRLSKLSKNECLTIYQILISFLRRKELILSRLSSSQQDSINTDDESFIILDKYYTGIKDFFDFIEQIQMTIEENEHLKIESIVTFRKIMTHMSKQLRKDSSFSRCDSIFKEIIEEFSQCFQTTLPLMDCASPIRSASSGGTLAGRRFLRSVAFLCDLQAAQYNTLLLFVILSPLTPLPIVIDHVPEKPIEEKPIDIPVESVFMWQKTTKNKDSKKIEDDSSNKKRYRRRKSQRCLDLSTIQEKSFDSDSVINHSVNSDDKISSQSISSGSTRQPLGEIDINSFNNEERQQAENENSNTSQHSMLFSLVSGNDKENLSITIAKRTITTTNIEPPRKKQKKTNSKVLVPGQKMITNFFQSKN